MIAQSDTTPWPEAVIAVAGILLVTVLAAAMIWQVAATVRARAAIQREEAYRKLAEESTAAQRRTAEQLERAVAELGELRSATSELERVMKTVE